MVNVVTWQATDRFGDSYETKRHVTIDGVHAACSNGGQRMPDEISIVTKPGIPWQEQVNCYNCAYRLSIRGKLGDYVRPRNGQDFPLRKIPCDV